MDKDYQNFVARMGSFEHDVGDITSGEVITHHGIKGMHWGVRRTPAQLSSTKQQIDAASSIVKETKNITSAVGHVRAASKVKDIKDMSDQDLREMVNRMNLEQQYSKLTINQTSKGQAYVKDTLDIAGGVLGVAGSAVAIAVGIQKLKG